MNTKLPSNHTPVAARRVLGLAAFMTLVSLPGCVQELCDPLGVYDMVFFYEGDECNITDPERRLLSMSDSPDEFNLRVDLHLGDPGPSRAFTGTSRCEVEAVFEDLRIAQNLRVYTIAIEHMGAGELFGAGTLEIPARMCTQSFVVEGEVRQP